MSNRKENRFFSWFKKKENNKDAVTLIKNDKENKKKSLLSPKNKDMTKIIINKKEIKTSILGSLRNCFNKTKISFRNKIKSIFFRKKNVFNLEELEEQLLLSDVGLKTTDQIINEIRKETNYLNQNNNIFLYNLLKEKMLNILKVVEKPLDINVDKLFVMLIVGVNGVGKTTTVGKLAYFYKSIGKSVSVVAADTFRAAAIEQLQEISSKHSIPISFDSYKTDPASLVFKAIHEAKKSKINILIIDTAGRLHNKVPLMEELKKIKRVIKKIEGIIFNETIVVIDASIGQNSINQVKLFNEYLGLSGIILTKLDGTSKGGIIFNLANKFKIPVQYVGTGEKITDLSYFKSSDFVKEIF
ncbi:signal recognition particle-docking protein FtsY [Buchnera aphidicola (Mindarus keteleerifoliae)]|uniref:signal recognition particle-docking protein FtsY n=1 Tax=Buchnera aphidicola TaxID=9 RepID=UPI0031B6C730